jgi:hypothetical protein
MRRASPSSEAPASARSARPANARDVKSVAERRPGVVALARKLRPGRTLRAISAELAVLGYLAGSGKPFEPSVVARMLRG